MHRFLMGVIAPFLLTTTAFAADYYVSKAGSDAQSGSFLKPWLTIQKAADTIKAGDRVYVMAGVYDERVFTTKDGTKDKPILFSIYNKDLVDTRGFVIGHDFIHIKGFQITGTLAPKYKGYVEFISGSDSSLVSDCKILKGAPHRFGARFCSGTSNCAIMGCAFYQVDWIILDVHGQNHQAVNNVLAQCPGWDAVRLFGCGHLIKNNCFEQINKTGTNHTDLFQTFGTNGDCCYNIIVEGNMAWDCDAQIGNFEDNGQDIRDFVFRNNVFFNVTSTANMFCKGMKWHNNTFYNCATRNNNSVLYFGNKSGKGCADNSECYNNLFVGCAGTNDPSSGWYSVSSGVSNFKGDYNFVTQMNWAPKINFNETHGLNGGDPGFLNLTSGDFHLKANSPLISKGKTLDGFNWDKDQRIRSKLWDMGAYEYLPEKPKNLKITH